MDRARSEWGLEWKTYRLKGLAIEPYRVYRTRMRAALGLVDLMKTRCASSGIPTKTHWNWEGGRGINGGWLTLKTASVTVTHFGAVAQLGERLNGIQEVEGSTPFGSTFFPGLLGLASHGLRTGLFSFFDALIRSLLVAV